MAASLKGIDPKLKQYVKRNKLPEVYEAILTGLSVMCPEDPHQFIVDCLRKIQQNGFDTLEWDMFVPEEMRPPPQMLVESNLDLIFNFDENMQPTPEMYEKAYSHYNKKLAIIYFSAWMQYHLQRRRKRADFVRKMVIAADHYRNRILSVHLETWRGWRAYRRGRQTMAYNKIQHVFNVAMGRVIFQAWHNVTLDAKRTREYFERLERGENMDDDDLFGNGSGEALDEISNLPRKVAIMIFSYVDICDLARCACVCRSWKILTHSSSLWSRLDLTQVRYRLAKGPRYGFDRDWITDQSCCKLLSKCRPYLVHLNMRGCSQVTSTCFPSIRECRNLQDINLSECPAVDDDNLRMVLEGCRILLFLNVSYTDITDASLRTIAKSCHNLQFLSISYCKRFTDNGLRYLSVGKGAKKLIYLDLSGCLQITPEGFSTFSKGCTELQSLILNDFFPLDDSCIQAITANSPNLRHLSLLGSPNLSDNAFKSLAGAKKLQKLKIESNQKISDSSFRIIGKNCHELHLLYMVDCQRITDHTLKSLVSCRNLTIINLADCVRVTDTGVRYIVESTCGSKLQELNLTNCVRVGDMAMVNIHKRCHSISYLSICYCEQISEAGIELLGQTHSLTSLDISGCKCGDQGLSSLGNAGRLRDVNISECVAITDLGLQKFSQQCTEIDRLDLSHCQQITDGAIKNLAFCCRMLTYLNMAGLKLVTDLSVQYLSGVCHYLRSLDISGSLHITDKSLKYLRKGCKRLQVLNMLYCRNITKQGVQKMSRHVLDVQHSDEEIPGYYDY